MNAFLLLYAMAVSIELVLSLLMAIFLYLIIAPVGRQRDEPQTQPKPVARPLARTVEGALGDAFAAISENRDDLTALTNARALLLRYSNDLEHKQQMAG